MGYFSNTALIFLIAGCAFLIFAKLLKIEKFASLLVLGVILLGLALYFTGYDRTIYRIIFEAPPIQPATPEDLRNR